jgi:hypothetical protein
MPRRSSPPPPQQQPPTIAPGVAVKRLRELAQRLKEAANAGRISREDRDALGVAIERTMTAAFGANHPAIQNVRYAYVRARNMAWGEDQYAQAGAEDAQLQAKMLEEYAAQMEQDIADAPPAAPKQIPPLHQIEQLLARFHRVARRLRSRRAQRQTLEVEDEYDVQDLLHALLTLFFDDIRPEEWTPSYAGKSARMDFLLKAEKIVLEIKMTRPGLGEKEIGDQLIVDIDRYRSHPDCRALVCFVYDPLGKIGNPDGLERDLSRVEDSLIVRVIVAPKS